MPGAHLKNRERGRIVLHDGVKLDTMARLVAANDARIELGERAAIGMGTVINAGRDVLLGRGCLTAAHCVIDVSDHGIAAGAPIQSQPFDHAPSTSTRTCGWARGGRRRVGADRRRARWSRRVRP